MCTKFTKKNKKVCEFKEANHRTGGGRQLILPFLLPLVKIESFELEGAH